MSVALDRSAPDYIGSWDNSDSKGSESWISHWQDYSWAHIYTHSYTEKATGQVYEWTYAGSGRHAGDVTYFSRGSYCVWWYTTGDGVCDSPTDYYTWNYEAKNQYGTRMAFGDTYSISQELSSGGQVFTASPELILQPYNHTYDTGKVCYNWSDWWYYGLTGTNCYQNKGSWIGKVGYAEHHTSR